MTFEDIIKETKWQKGMDDETDVIKKNNTWELLEGQKTIVVKWIYKKNSEIDKYKTHLVTKCY